jgi:hypothetical protein
MLEHLNFIKQTPRIMKTQTRTTTRIALTAVAMAFAACGQAQLPYAVDLRSSNNGVSGSPLADKLYNDSTLGPVNANRLPAGTSFWLVVDGANNGVNFATALPGTTFDINSLLQADDALFQTTLPVAGRISRTVSNIPADLRMSSDPGDLQYVFTKPMWGLLFNESNVDSDKPGDPGFDPLFDGAKFGVVSFGSKQIPEFGNAIAVITNPLYADTFNFQPVPEPATTALFAGTLLGLGAVVRRVRQNRR